MSDEQTTSKIPKIRTFADDFQRTKPKVVKPVEEKEPADTPVPDTPKPPTPPPPPRPTVPQPPVVTPTPKPSVPQPIITTPPVKPSELEPTRPPTPIIKVKKKEPQTATLTIPKAIKNERTIDPASIPIGAVEQNNIKSILSDTANTYEINNDGVESGSIVREKKNKKFHLGKAIVASLSAWFSNHKAIREHKAAQKPKVATADTRVDTIASAAKFGVLPEGDSQEEVAAKLKEQPRNTPSPSVQIKEAPPSTAPTWSYKYTDESENTSVDEAMTEPSNVPTGVDEVPAPEKEKVTTTDSASLEIEEKMPYDIRVFSELKNQEATTEEQQEVAPPNVIEAVEAAPAPEIAAPSPIVPTVVEDTNVNDDLPEKEVIPQITEKLIEEVPLVPPPQPVTEEVLEEPVLKEDAGNRASKNSITFRPTEDAVPSLFSTRLLVILIIASLLGVGVAFGGYRLYQILTNTTPVVSTVTAPITTDSAIGVPLSPQRENFLRALTAAEADETVTQFYPVMAASDGAVVPAPIGDLLSVLALSAPGSFTRSLETITFGKLNNQQQFIILSTNNFDAAFSGMLQWERNIITDLQPWFGTSPAASFTDITTTNRDLRTARRSDGSEIFYTFLDRNMILISTDRATIQEINSRR